MNEKTTHKRNKKKGCVMGYVNLRLVMLLPRPNNMFIIIDNKCI